MSLKSVISTLKKNKRFLISTHVSPDPDALCSELALVELLKALKKEVIVVNEDKVPSRYLFLKGVQQVKSLHVIKKVDYDAALIVDCGDLSRIGRVQSLLHPEKMLINIDHHITNDSFGHVNCLNSYSSSTCEIIFDLFREAKIKVNQAAAEHIYIGMMTDTGSFRFENTTAKTHQIVSELLKYPIAVYDLYKKLYESMPFQDIKIFTQVLGHFEEYEQGRVISVALPSRIVKKFSEDFDLRDSIFKFFRSIAGVEVIVIFTEINSKETRINLRSTSIVDVAKIAHRFKGGGHKRASGAVVRDSIPMAKKLLIKEILRNL